MVVCNAGYGLFGAAEDLSDEQVSHIIATNLTGSIQLIRAALPHLRAQGGGRIIQISTYGGHIAFPGNSMYHATKWGIEGFSESVAQEVAPFGIGVTIVEPGMIRTGFYDAATRVPTSKAYRGGPADREPIPLDQMPGDQGKVVAAMIDAAVSADPPRRAPRLGRLPAGTRGAGRAVAALEAQKDLAASTDVDGWPADG